MKRGSGFSRQSGQWCKHPAVRGGVTSWEDTWLSMTSGQSAENGRDQDWGRESKQDQVKDDFDNLLIVEF